MPTPRSRTRPAGASARYELAGTYTAFYDACLVLKAPDDQTRRARLALCALTAATGITGRAGRLARVRVCVFLSIVLLTLLGMGSQAGRRATMPETPRWTRPTEPV